MPETGATWVPKALTQVASDPMTELLAALLGLNEGRLVAGMALTYDGLTAHIAPGRCIVRTDSDPPSAYYVTFANQVDKALQPNASNYLYADVQGNIIVNQTGVEPADAIPLYRVNTGASTVTSTVNLFTSTIDVGVQMKLRGLDLAGFELVNLGAPLGANSAIRKTDLDAAVGGIGGIKTPVRAATTANIVLSGLQTVDGVVLASQDRVLVKNQTAPAENGIYVALTTAWTRATDFDSAAEMIGGTLVSVSEGPVNGNGTFGLDTDNPIVVGTTALTFTRKDVGAHAALTIAHGATEAATPSTMVARDAAGRAKFVAGAAAGDALIHGQVAAGDLTGAYPDPAIGLNKVDNTKLRDSAALSVIGNATNVLADPADIVAGTDGFVLRRSGTTLGFGQIGTASLIVNSVDNTVLRDSAALSVIGRSANSVGDPADIVAAADNHVLRRSGTTIGFGTILAAAVSDFDTQVRTSRLDQMAAPTAAVSLNNQNITNLAAATANGMAVRYEQVFGANAAGAIDAAYGRAVADWVTEGPMTALSVFEGGNLAPQVLSPHKTGVQMVLAFSGLDKAYATREGFPSIATEQTNNSNATDWDAGDKLEMVAVLAVNSLATIPGGNIAGLLIHDQGSIAPNLFSKTASAGRSIAVGPDSTGLIFVVTNDGVTKTATSTGVTVTAGTRFKVKVVFTKGTNVVVTIDANAPTTVTATLPTRLGYYGVGGRLNGSSGTYTIDFLGGFWKLTV